VDVLSKEFITELEQLQDNVPAFGIQEAKKIVAEQLGAPVESKFSYFEDVPIAAASLGQVRDHAGICAAWGCRVCVQEGGSASHRKP
jgi:ubiquinone biosynthesis protein